MKGKINQWIASLCTVLCLATGTIGCSIPTQAQTFLQIGDTLFTLPDFSIQQKKDLARDMDLVDKALYEHKTTITLPLTQADKLCQPKKQKDGMFLYVLTGALAKHHTTLQHGYYMSSYLRDGDVTKVTPSGWTWTLSYHTSKTQERQAWQYAQKLVKQQRISSNFDTGIQQIYQYLVQNISYDQEAETALFSENGPPTLTQVTAYGAWLCPKNGKHMTTCGGYAQMFYLMCRAMGWNNVYCVSDYHAHHAFNVIQEKDGLHYFDACLGAAHSAQKYFNMSESTLQERGVMTQDLRW